MPPEIRGDLEIISLMSGHIDKGTVAGKSEIFLGGTGADGLFRLTANVTPEMPRYRIFLNPDWIGGESRGAAVIVKIDGQITCFLRHQIVDAAGEFTAFQAHRFWQSQRQIGLG